MLAAMVLAAGLGTRLRPLTDHRAKPLVPVGDRPLLAHILERLRASGVGRVVVNGHHRVGDIRAFARNQVDLIVSEEADLLGTAGGVAQARAMLGDGDVLLWNGDALAEPDLVSLVSAHAASAAVATLIVQMRPRGEGTVGIDPQNRIVRLRAECVGDEAHGGEFVGIHVLGRELGPALPSRGCLVGDVYIPALRRGALLRAVPYAGPFFDVGTLRRYLDANLAWLAARAAANWSGDGVRIEPGVVLAQTILGANASVKGEGSLTRCVVWPGAVARAPLADAVVSGSLVVGIGEGARLA